LLVSFPDRNIYYRFILHLYRARIYRAIIASVLLDFDREFVQQAIFLAATIRVNPPPISLPLSNSDYRLTRFKRFSISRSMTFERIDRSSIQVKLQLASPISLLADLAFFCSIRRD